MRYMVIFDINGVLAQRSGKYWLIPDAVHPFLDKLSRVSDIAIWTSTTRRNAEFVVDNLNINPVFTWYREDTPKDTQVCHGTLKNLSLVKELYDYSSYLIVDDSYSKIRHNHDDEKIIHCTDFNDPENSYQELYDLILDKLSL